MISGCLDPIPLQKSFNPPPEPVLSTIGVGNLVFLPNASATAVEKGNTVDEPTMCIVSLALAKMFQLE